MLKKLHSENPEPHLTRAIFQRLHRIHISLMNSNPTMSVRNGGQAKIDEIAELGSQTIFSLMRSNLGDFDLSNATDDERETFKGRLRLLINSFVDGSVLKSENPEFLELSDWKRRAEDLKKIVGDLHDAVEALEDYAEEDKRGWDEFSRSRNDLAKSNNAVELKRADVESTIHEPLPETPVRKRGKLDRKFGVVSEKILVYKSKTETTFRQLAGVTPAAPRQTSHYGTHFDYDLKLSDLHSGNGISYMNVDKSTICAYKGAKFDYKCSKTCESGTVQLNFRCIGCRVELVVENE